MTPNTQESALRQGAFTDLEVRLIYADFLEEQGKLKRAKFWRAAYSKQYEPEACPSYGYWAWSYKPELSGFYAWHFIMTQHDRNRRKRMLPRAVWLALPKEFMNDGTYNDKFWKYFHSLERAWYVLEAAWIKTHFEGKP